MAAKPKPRMLGRHIVADPAVCHGQPTFRGTRILVADVLEQVSTGMAGESISLEYRRYPYRTETAFGDSKERASEQLDSVFSRRIPRHRNGASSKILYSSRFPATG